MKKTLIALLTLLLALAYTACTGNTAATTTAANQETEEQEYYYYGILASGSMTETEYTEYYHKRFQEMGLKTWSDGTSFTNEKAVFYDDMNSALLGLQRMDVGEVDLPQSVCEYAAAMYPDRYVAEDYGDTEENALSMAVMEENAALLEKLNAAISSLQEDGTLAALEAEYLSDLTKIHAPEELPKTADGETVRVLVTGDMAPFDYVTADGKAAGFNIAFLKAIAEKTNLNFELTYANAGSRFINLTSGKVDVVFWVCGSRYSDTAEFDFTIDMPEGVAATVPYTVQKCWGIFLAE